MNTFRKVILYALGIFSVYSLIASLTHMPIMGVGLFLFLPVVLCIGMFLYMDHKVENEFKLTNAHQH